MDRSSFLIILFFSLSLGSYAQINKSGEENADHSGLQVVDEALPEEGTYQIIVSDERVRVELSEGLLREVSERRAEDSTVFIQVNQYAKIKVLPFSEIEKEAFTPIEKYRYEEVD